ncbi:MULTISPECIES: hypothetical protein [unclassified Sulfurospirillum]|nr:MULTISPECIES: hypothetical protein [unclassified Sulfurospirillum]
MSACDIACAKPNNAASPKSKNVEKPEQNSAKNAKERLLFCKCTC